MHDNKKKTILFRHRTRFPQFHTFAFALFKLARVVGDQFPLQRQFKI